MTTETQVLSEMLQLHDGLRSLVQVVREAKILQKGTERKTAEYAKYAEFTEGKENEWD